MRDWVVAMHQATVELLAFTLAVLVAIRSTWSPCGISMLSTLTPFSERSRGHRYAVTATWFVLGALMGGVVLGAILALAAAAVGAGQLSVAVTAAAIVVAAAVVVDAFSTKVVKLNTQSRTVAPATGLNFHAP